MSSNSAATTTPNINNVHFVGKCVKNNNKEAPVHIYCKWKLEWSMLVLKFNYSD